MIEGATIFEFRAMTSVKLGHVFVSPREVQSCLNDFVRNLVNYDARIQGNELQLIGSATGISTFNRRYFVATMHQIKGVQPQDVAIVVPDTEICMTTAGFTEISSDASDDDMYDLCAFDFTPQREKTQHLNGNFFELGPATVWDSEDEVMAFFAIGHAFDD